MNETPNEIDDELAKKVAALLDDHREERQERAREAVRRRARQAERGAVEQVHIHWDAFDEEVLAQVRTTGAADPEIFAEFGRRSAADEIPLAEVHALLWEGFDVDWDCLVRYGVRSGLDETECLRAGSVLWSVARRMTTAATEAYRQVSTDIAVRREVRSAALVSALLHDRFTDPGTTFDALVALDLPPQGRFCVVVIERGADGDDTMCTVSRALEGIQVSSARHVEVDTGLLLAHLPAHVDLDRVAEAIGSSTTAKVGISTQVEGLDFAAAWKFARLALETTDPAHPVRIFGQAIVASVVTALAPDILRRLSETDLHALMSLTAGTQESLLETFFAWLDNGGSVDVAAGAVHRHPNTVRYRLKKLEDITGRSLSDPRDVADLALVLEFVRAEITETGTGTD